MRAAFLHDKGVWPGWRWGLPRPLPRDCRRLHAGPRSCDRQPCAGRRHCQRGKCVCPHASALLWAAVDRVLLTAAASNARRPNHRPAVALGDACQQVPRLVGLGPPAPRVRECRGSVSMDTTALHTSSETRAGNMEGPTISPFQSASPAFRGLTSICRSWA